MVLALAWARTNRGPRIRMLAGARLPEASCIATRPQGSPNSSRVLAATFSRCFARSSRKARKPVLWARPRGFEGKTAAWPRAARPRRPWPPPTRRWSSNRPRSRPAEARADSGISAGSRAARVLSSSATGHRRWPACRRAASGLAPQPGVGSPPARRSHRTPAGKGRRPSRGTGSHVSASS